eukprot:TRINITY_DN4674_c0_g1_i1.p1 TRINITY_DN4674_c0_g1~~TRINITY_DN4674_c0_g1_i1.p1  ORF type:complete len:355 (-),score=106.60 TRINITY_DN4674_c0_g1_i1:8-1072(-)
MTTKESAEQVLLRQIALLAGQINRQKQNNQQNSQSFQSNQNLYRQQSASYPLPKHKKYIPPPSLLRSSSLPSISASNSTPSRSIYSISSKNPPTSNVNNDRNNTPSTYSSTPSIPTHPYKRFKPISPFYSRFIASKSKYSTSLKQTNAIASPGKLRWFKDDFKPLKKEENGKNPPPSASKRIVINRGIKQNKYRIQNGVSLSTPRKAILSKKLESIRQKKTQKKENQKPQCTFFLRGVCTNKDCQFSHVYISPTAPVCKDFRNGHCPNGNLCKMKHPMICPEFESTGKCDNPRTCKLKHKRSQSLYSTRKAKGEEEEMEGNEEEKEESSPIQNSIPSISSNSLLPHFDDSFTMS